MNTNMNLNTKEPVARDSLTNLDSLNNLMLRSLHIRSHFELMLWLQGDVQQFLPHQAMIAAWGDFSLGIINIDIVSAIPGIKSGMFSSPNLTSLLQNLFKHWHDHSKSPYSLFVEKGVFHNHELGCKEEGVDLNHLKSLKLALIHGIKDYRGGHDCLYMFLGDTNLHSDSRKMIGVLMPYIDSTLRQLQYVPGQLADVGIQQPESEFKIVGTLSNREFEIMTWVKMGKTNQEIGSILNISTFTVKNHLQRILKKLNVINRTQAVTQFNRIYQVQ
ncbi:MAG TPA: XrtB/PEP-CTERM-associated transcriptional regulator EpsA [Methylotenera sp.]|nr:XrtB/PEP-CTERM-associated transcriptional regulator EpsA [Methylotenera sp.]